MNKLSTSTVPFALPARTRRCHRVILAASLLLSGFLVSSVAAGPFIYVANTGEDTVSKIDVSSNTEVARYATWFTPGSPNHVAPRLHLQTQAGPCPSRIAKDAAGDVYVLDRFFIDALGKLHLPVLLKIALSGGGPTSTGPTALPITDGTNPNHIDPSEATDKLILWTNEIGNPASSATTSNPTDEGALGRALCTDTTGALWVGMYGTRRYYKVDPATGAVIGGPVDTPGHTPYGCQVDVNGKLWSVDENNTLASFDTKASAPVATVRSHPGLNYSLSLFNDCSSMPPKVKVYLSDRSGQTYIAFDAQTSTFSYPPPSSVPKFASLSVAVDSKGNIISGALSSGQVIKVSPSSTLLWDTTTAGPTQPTTNLHGLIVDDNDDVWAVHLPNDRVVKYSGANGQFMPPMVPVGIMPYTYGNTPPATCTGAPSPSPTPTPTPTPGCTEVTAKEVRCEPGGGYSYTFNVANNSGSAMSQILLTPAQGSTFTLNPQLTNLSPPLQNGQSTTVTTNIGNAKPGDKVCFFVSLMSEKASCCTVQVCPTMPRCADTYPPATPRRPPAPVKRRR